MGAAKSKLSRVAAIETRRFPTRPSPTVRARAPPSHDPLPPASPSSPVSAPDAPDARNDARDAAHDPHSPYDRAFAARLHSLGVVAPNPFLPLTQQQQQPPSDTTTSGASARPSPATNPALLVLRARAKLQREWDAQQQRQQKQGRRGADRQFVDVASLRRALEMREAGVEEAAIAERLGLRDGVLERLGGRVKLVDVRGLGEWRVKEK